MKIQELFVGALILKTETFVTLRERSDVFYRGFLVLLFGGLIAGVFAGLVSFVDQFLPPPPKQIIIETAVEGFRGSYQGPEALKPLIEQYISESVSMVYDLIALPPRAGEGARPMVALLEWLGTTLTMPLTFAFMGRILFAGLVIQLTSRGLGGRASIAQMLGLSCLAAAPEVFTALPSLLTLFADVSGMEAIRAPNGLLGLLISLWELAIYVKATAVAQQFSMGRALGAIALGVGLVIVLAVLAAFVIAFIAAAIIVSLLALLSS